MSFFSKNTKQKAVPPSSDDRLFRIMEQGPINENISSTQHFQEMTDRLGKAQQNISSEIDARIESLQQEFNQLYEVDKQYRELAKVIEERWVIVNFDMKKLSRILDYHMKNKEKRIALGNELVVQHQKEKLEQGKKDAVKEA